MSDSKPQPVDLAELQKLTPSQQKVLRILARRPHFRSQLSGNNMAPVVASAKALQRRGLIGSPGSSQYYLCDHVREAALELLQAWRSERDRKNADSTI